MFEAYRSVPGVQFPVEHADGHAVGVFWIPNSIHPTARTRSYAMLGHYENAGGPHTRDNFHLLPGHRVTQIGLKETGSADRAWSAKSVVITPRDGELPATPLRIEVRREVVVAAGSFHTPQVLQRSGIGPRAVLEAAGVDVKVELPGVGMYLQVGSTVILRSAQDSCSLIRTPIGPSELEHGFQLCVFPKWSADLILTPKLQSPKMPGLTLRL
jgi:choline dehydrogenase-like flavoprotein